jgi:histidyl-tRNA synthetase
VKALQPVRGTRDLLPDESRRLRHVVETGRSVAALYGYDEIATPIFEFSDVFSRTLGDTSDVVMKEMYSFADRGGENLTLRPEGTAGVVRAVVSGGLAQHLPLKFFYAGPMFRYDRPQKGRFRQFHQIGIELLGVPEPAGDVETIALGAHILERLGVLGKCVLELNTLGDAESRAAYRAALVEHFAHHEARLSEDSRQRLKQNPLRILDSKDEGDRKLIENAPVFFDYLNETSRDFFASVERGLKSIGIAYALNARIVRGLDYYCHTVFEFTTDALGSQGAVLAGGRYDGLAETMGGPKVPGVGWAAGVDRLALLVDDVPARERPVAVIPIGDVAEATAQRIARDLRHRGVAVELGFRGNLKRRLQRADKLGARAAVLLGEDELARSSATVRNLDSGEQSEVPLDTLVERLARER